MRNARAPSYCDRVNLRFEQPLWLWMLIVLPAIAWTGFAWFSAMSRARRFSAVVFRAVLMTMLAFMLSGLSMVRKTDALAVVVVLDVSESVRRWGVFGDTEQPTGATDFIARLRAFVAKAETLRGPEDLLGVVAFDGKAVTVALPTHGEISDRQFDVRVEEGTNIADALRLARSLIPPDAAGRIVLISDGNETAGDAISAASEAAGYARIGAKGRGLPIDVVPIQYDIRSETMIESVDAPPSAAADSTVNVRVTLSSTAGSVGTLRILNGEREVDINGSEPGFGRRLRISAGKTIEVVEVALDGGRFHRFKAIFEPDPIDVDGRQVASGDTLPDNNSGESFTITPGKGTVLLVDGVSRGGETGSGRTLEETLKRSRIEVTTVAPESMPTDLLSLQANDLIILENVPADSFPTEVHERLAAYVRDMGGGLVMIGGPDSFGPGGWKGTALEPILPVKLDLPERLIAPQAATIFVIDNSGSMSWPTSGSTKNKQEIANESTAMAIGKLDRTDLVGVIAFNSTIEVVIPLSRNKPKEYAELARGILPGGGTNMPPALDAAMRQLQAVDVKLKHVIVLSDGRSMGSELLVGKAKKMAEAGIKVSTIAVGNDSHMAIMQQMAQAGDGTYYPVINANILPQIFLKAVRIARSPLIREEPFEPVVMATGSPLTSMMSSPPVLNGIVLTQAREEPTITTAMVTPNGEPLLAHWNVELGRVAAFTSDAHHWAAPWLGWEGYGEFWTRLVRTMSRSAGGRAFSGSSAIRAGRMKLRVDALGEDGKPLDAVVMPATIFTPSGTQIGVALAQTAPGVYEGEAQVTESGTHVTIVKPVSGGKQLAPVVLGAESGGGVELRSLRSNSALLDRVAAATGGRVRTLIPDRSLFDRDGVIPQEAVLPLWKTLLLWAIGMLLLDIGTRRVAWDRFVSKEFGVELGKAAAEAVRDRSEQAKAALAGLRTKREVPVQVAIESPLALGDQDAKELIAAARDRRRKMTLEAAREAHAGQPDPMVESASAAPATPIAPVPDREASPDRSGSDGGLLAAKRRARERYEDGGTM